MNQDKSNLYHNSKIYKLISDNTNTIFIGSTCQPYLSQRLCIHRSNYNLYKAGQIKYDSSFELLQYNDCQIILLEKYPCSTKEELNLKESEIIQTLKEVNELILTRIKKVSTVDREKQRIKQNEYCKRYNRINKVAISEKRKRIMRLEYIYHDINRQIKRSNQIHYRYLKDKLIFQELCSKIDNLKSSNHKICSTN